MIGKIKRLQLREVWPHEALDFTSWLEKNIEVLNDVLDFSLANAEREQAVGTFSVDLVAEDLSGHTVIIENQLEKSDHDHLGKLLTYLVGVEAQAAIWIVSDPRPEHVNVINWLNESSAASFYLIKVEAIRIDDSSPAPLLTLIVGPSEEARLVGDTKKELAERHLVRQAFWRQLLDKAKQRTNLHANRSPGTDNWVSGSSGTTGLLYSYVILQHGTRLELSIDRGDVEENRRIFDMLAASKTEIEDKFGDTLDWDFQEGRRSCYLRKSYKDGGYQDRERWSQVQDKMIDTMIRMEKALRPYMKNL